MATSAPARSTRSAKRSWRRSGAEGVPTPAAVLGVLSLILWALIVVVTLKYVVILLRADNNGEGGTLALMALAQRAVGTGGATIVLLGIISGALFYGDAVITPAISVLSAIEGMKDVTLRFEPYIVPLTVGDPGPPVRRAVARHRPRRRVLRSRSCASGSRSSRLRRSIRSSSSRRCCTR